MAGVRGIRNLRAELQVPPGRKIIVELLPHNQEGEEIAAAGRELLPRLVGASEVSIIEASAASTQARTVPLGQLTIYLPLAELIDIEAERLRLQKELTALEREIERLETRLQTEGFLAKAPSEVIAQERTRLQDYFDRVNILKDRLIQLHT